MNAITHYYSKLYIQNVILFKDGSCKRKSNWQYKGRAVTNKVAVYQSDNDSDLIQDLYYETSNTVIASGSKLFVAPECKISRDTLRNSGYKIILDRDKADAIVIPDIDRRKYKCQSCNLVAMKDDDLYLIDISKPGWDFPVLNESDMHFVRKYLEDNHRQESDDVQKSSLRVWFLPKCEDIEDVLTGNARNVPYIQESFIPVAPSTVISPETLTFWENVDDDNLLMRTICTSDWAKYPVTLLCFLALVRDDNNWQRVANEDFRRILDKIGYQYNYYKGWVFQNRYIFPEDYAMLQSYLYFKLGVGEKGGFVTDDAMKKLPSELQEILQRRIALAPLTLAAPVTCESLKEMAKK